MNTVLGGLVGAIMGALAWRTAVGFVARGDAEHRFGGLASPPAALTLAGMALWGAFVGWRAASLAQAAAALAVVALLAAVTLVDLQVRLIPNALVLAGGGLFFLLALIGRGAMGAGDVKLAAALGAVLGWPAVLPALLYGIIAGGIAALLLLLLRRAGRKSAFAYGPYLALGAVIVLARSLLG